jgi:serine/threonine protein phosphatase PrpC
MQGKRPSMEDAHITIDDLAQTFADVCGACNEPRCFYGIYDGHRGQRAALYSAEHLHRVFANRPEFPSNIHDALHNAFLQTDEELLAKARADGGWNDGCTVAVAVLIGTAVHVANVGDAEVLLARRVFRDGRNSIDTVVLSKLHKPNDPEEKARVMANGGMVLGGRIGGALAVARALGDLQFKESVSDGEVTVGKLISEVPFISSTDLLPGRDLFLIVGCDGIWENLSHHDSVSFVHSNLQREGAQRTSEMLCEHAIARGSADNVSATIVAFRWS